jgi:3-hydroxyisobutyrate dehydrogenase
MARRIIEAGYPTTLWARRSATLEPFAGPQARLAGTRAELGTASDVLCVCVVDDAGVHDVLRGTEGALSAIAPGSVAVVHSTVHPATCVRLQQDFPAIHVVDAPVSGGAAELVARVGFRLDALAGTAGPLLAKDVGILADVAAVTRSPLLDAAEAALERMVIPQIPDEDA